MGRQKKDEKMKEVHMNKNGSKLRVPQEMRIIAREKLDDLDDIRLIALNIGNQIP